VWQFPVLVNLDLVGRLGAARHRLGYAARIQRKALDDLDRTISQKETVESHLPARKSTRGKTI
jgi:hypothetical protein